MNILFLNHIENARQSIRSNRLRSALTMLGITIGVASITTILALGTGASQIVGQQVDELGGNIAVVRPGAPEQKPSDGLRFITEPERFSASSLTESDIAAIENITNVKAVAPLMVLGGAVIGESTAPATTPIVASTPQLQKISDLKVTTGQFLDPQLTDNTVVIGPQLSIDIFGTEQSIGKTISIKGSPFIVIGILERANNPINYNNVDFDKAAIINFASGKQLNQNASHIQQINVQSESVTQLDGVIVEINKALLKSHFQQADFVVHSGEEIAQPTSHLFSVISGVSVAIAAISLIVGGVGVMNIMLVSVAERTREIGIRKALGATNWDIVAQFMIESLALSIGGGIAGLITGYGLAFVISTFLTFSPALSWPIAGVAFAMSVGVGVLFGLYPAIRAAKKDPISALRQYD